MVDLACSLVTFERAATSDIKHHTNDKDSVQFAQLQSADVFVGRAWHGIDCDHEMDVRCGTSKETLSRLFPCEKHQSVEQFNSDSTSLYLKKI